MIFSKPNALVYVHRGGLVVAGKHITQARLDFKPELVRNLDVLDTTKLVERCQQFFTDNHLEHKRILVVLDPSVIFEKKIELDETGQPGTLAEAFVDAMPFGEGQRACLQLQTAKRLQLIATNADLYQAIQEALKASNVSKITGITPVAAYDLSGTDRKLSTLVELFLKETGASKVANFVAIEPL